MTMQNDYDRELKTKAFNAASSESTTTTTATTESAATMLMATTESVAATTPQVENDGDCGVGEQQPLPASGSFFKAGVGFLAWALWGHIPLYDDGEQMLSHLFSDVKANSSYGRGTSTRSAMRKALIAASAAPIDNRRGKKRNADTMREPAIPVVDNDANEDFALLTKTLEHLSAESIEKEEKKKHHQMCLCLGVCNKLAP